MQLKCSDLPPSRLTKPDLVGILVSQFGQAYRGVCGMGHQVIMMKVYYGHNGRSVTDRQAHLGLVSDSIGCLLVVVKQYRHCRGATAAAIVGTGPRQYSTPFHLPIKLN